MSKKSIILLLLISLFICTSYSFADKQPADTQAKTIIINGDAKYELNDDSVITKGGKLYISLSFLEGLLPYTYTWDKTLNLINITTDNKESNLGYKSLKDTNHFQKITQDFIKSKYFPSDSIVVIGDPDCSACNLLIPKLDNVLGELKINSVFYLPADRISNKFASDFNLEYIPTILLFKDGKIYNSIVGDKSEKELSTILIEHFKN